jgi:hypothetical protein
MLKSVVANFDKVLDFYFGKELGFFNRMFFFQTFLKTKWRKLVFKKNPLP